MTRPEGKDEREEMNLSSIWGALEFHDSLSRNAKTIVEG